MSTYTTARITQADATYMMQIELRFMVQSLDSLNAYADLGLPLLQTIRPAILQSLAMFTRAQANAIGWASP